jgi:hypothetical protein
MSTEQYNTIFRSTFYQSLELADEDSCIDAWTEKYWALPTRKRQILQDQDPFFVTMDFYVT